MMRSGEWGIVDTHCHLWHLELARQTGLTPDFGPIFRTFSPADFSAAASPAGVSACVLVESGKTSEENGAMEKMAASSNLIAAFTPYVDLASPALENELDRWHSNPKFRGVRARFEGHSDPDILTRPKVIDGIIKLAERGLVVELLVRAGHLKQVLKIYDKVPQLKAIIEHMAKPDFKAGSDRIEWNECMEALASDTSAVCKLSLSPRVEQLGEVLKAPGQGWPVDLVRPYVQSLLEWFGPRRLMWGSDWPIALFFASYQGTLNAMQTAVGNLMGQDEERIFRTNATEFYRLNNTLEGATSKAFETNKVNIR
jgi:L-fuconolactonase